MVTIEDLAPADFELVSQWLSRPDINRWLSGDWRNREANPTILAVAKRNRKNQLYLVRSDKTPCGLVALADLDLADKLAMIWYVLGDAKFAGRGITSEAVRQVSQRAFEQIGLAVIYAWVVDGNIPSRRVLEKSGFRECGRIRNAANLDGRQVERIYFDLVPFAEIPRDAPPSRGCH